MAYFLVTKDPLIYPYVEPFWMFGLHLRTPILLTLLGTLLLTTVFVRNAYCRFLCPLGAFLGIMSNLTVFRIKRWSECSTCRICEKACEWGAIRGPKIIMTECVRCDDCERLYEDTKKCPHHLILIRKADILARRAASTPGIWIEELLAGRLEHREAPLESGRDLHLVVGGHNHAFDVRAASQSMPSLPRRRE